MVTGISSRCKTCGDVLLTVEGDSQSGVLDCINCKAKQPVMKQQNFLKPVTQAEADKFFNEAESEPVKTVGVAKRSTTVMTLGRPETLFEVYDRVLNDLRSLPMPKDIKQFKKIQKVIKLVEELNNGNEHGCNQE